MSSIFGGNTGITYDDIQRKRAVAESLRASNSQTPRNVGEGIAAIGRAIAGRAIERRTDRKASELDAQWKEQVGGMGLDPDRAALYGRLPYEARDPALLSYMNAQDAERKAAARAAAARGASAAKDAEAREREMAAREAIKNALMGTRAPTPGVQPGPTMEAANAGATSGQDLTSLQTTYTPPTAQSVQLGLLTDPNVPFSMIDNAVGMLPEQPDLTGTQREYEMAVRQGFQGSFLDYKTALAEAGRAQTSVTTNVGGDSAPGLGNLSTDYGYIMNPETGQPVIDPNTGLPTAAPVPGSLAAQQIQDAARTSEVATENKERSGGVVTEDIGQALNILEADPNWTTGFGAALSVVPGTEAKSLKGLLQTIKANVGFDRLQQMRDASVTGGALGAINKTEMDLLQAVLGNLDQSLSAQDLARSLKRVNDIYLDIIHGPGNRPPEAAQGGWQTINGVRVRVKQ